LIRLFVDRFKFDDDFLTRWLPLAVDSPQPAWARERLVKFDGQAARATIGAPPKSQ
jgi:hypothetical protein